MGVVSELVDGVAEITLDWPEARNALGPAQARELRTALEAAVADERTGAVVVSARGSAFCAGGNLPEVVRLAAEGEAAVRSTIYGEFQGMMRAIRTSPAPVIVAVDGAAVGLGCDLALAGSATFIGEKGWLAQGWIHAGLVPATGGVLYATERGGPQAVWRLLAQDRVDARTAEAWGLAIACACARTEALAMAARLAKLPRRPLKAMVELSRIADAEDHLARALDHQAGFITDPAFPEAVRRLLERN